ncbi:MAG TPA: hypothetical protein VN285_07930 [Candidatus Deferrimicrobium sp.]|nr:hypothetical protein [Candidatus Deferrimicrobium sp.]
MRRSLIVLCFLLLLMSASSFATNTRVLTMGENNTILLDEANIWLFPSRIMDYPNIAVGEFGDGDFMNLGIHWKFDEDNPWMLGTYLYNSDVVYPMGRPLPPLGYRPQFVPFDDFSLLSNQRIDLFYGRRLGVNQIPFGFHFGAVHSSQRNDDASDQREEGLSMYTFETGLTLGGGATDIAAGFELMTWKDKENFPADTSVFDESKPKGNYSLYAQARHFWQPGPPPWTVVPHASVYKAKNEAEYYEIRNPGAPYTDDTLELAQTDKYSWFGFELGTGLQYAPSNDAMVVLDFGFRYDKVDGDFTVGSATVEATAKTFTIPFFRAGADLKVFDWMDVRLGSTSYWERFTRENDASDKLLQDFANNNTYLGFGFHWGDLHVDTYTHPDLFLKGFNFISGETTSMNFAISALYEIM